MVVATGTADRQTEKRLARGANYFIDRIGANLCRAGNIRVSNDIHRAANEKREADLHVRFPSGDSVAVIGENRKLLLFPLSELPEMRRGKGVRLQRYKDGALADAKVFDKKEGLTYLDAAKRSFTLSATELRDWWGQRAQAGRLPPKGFPKSGKFGPRFNDH